MPCLSTAARGIIVSGLLCSMPILSGCTNMVARIPAQGAVAGSSLQTEVDDSAARYFLQQYLAGQREQPKLDRRFVRFANKTGPAIPNADELARLSRRTSPDTAALVLAQRLLEQPENQSWMERLKAEMLALERDTQEQRRSYLSQSPYRILFVPGWLHRSKPWTGADFASTRRYLASLGVDSVLIETGENDTVEHNALYVAQQLRAWGQTGRPLIVVSGSKGGPETAEAVGALMTPEETRPIKAWVNICGALRGSPIADDYVKGTGTLVSRTIFALNGWGGLEGMQSLSYALSRARADRQRLPEHLFVVSYFGIPLSGEIRVFNHQFTYQRLRQYGPNDGLVLLADEIAPKGPVLPEVGRAHFLRDPDIHLRQGALIQAVARHLNESQPYIARNTP